MTLRHLRRFWLSRNYDLYIDEEERQIVLKNDTGMTIYTFDY
jgi:hypothetical protein